MKSSGGFKCWYVRFGGEISQLMEVFSTDMLLKKAQGCCQLPFCVVLTFLQLSHHVIVLEESIATECVCKQHLKKGDTWVFVKTCRHEAKWKTTKRNKK